MTFLLRKNMTATVVTILILTELKLVNNVLDVNILQGLYNNI